MIRATAALLRLPKRGRKMPLVVLCGLPCAGKSDVAARIAAAARAAGHPAVVLADGAAEAAPAPGGAPGAHPSPAADKDARSALRSRADRALGRRGAVVVVDAGNEVSGYRYELWCLARTAAARFCVVHVDTPLAACAERNAARRAAGGPFWADAALDEAAARFERPEARRRWDAPLFTVSPTAGDEGVEAQAAAVVAAATAGAAAAAAAAAGAGAAATGGAAGRALAPARATDAPAQAATNLLHELDAAAQGVVDAVMAAQAAAGGGGDGPRALALPGGGAPLRLRRPVGLPELGRHKRAFLRLLADDARRRPRDARAAAAEFVEFLRGQLEERPAAERAAE